MDTMERRRNAIAALINQKGTVSFSTIKEHFPNVSEMTLRTDLKALDEAKQIKNQEVAEYLSLPPVKAHCSVLAEEAIDKAIENYLSKQKEKDGKLA